MRSRTEAQRRIYRVSLGPLREVDEWLAPFRYDWTDTDDRNALERHLAIMEALTRSWRERHRG